jgi:hypothetical protein
MLSEAQRRDRRTYYCADCDDWFSAYGHALWHCPFCSHHWQSFMYHCKNCRRCSTVQRRFLEYVPGMTVKDIIARIGARSQ